MNASDFTRDALKDAPDCLYRGDREVRFQDVDAAGTVFYPRVLEYFADAYMALLAHGGVDVVASITSARWFAPIAHAEADYLAPMRFGAKVGVEVVTTRLGRTSATVGYRVRGEGGAVLAVGHTVHVFVDGASFAPTPVPDEVRAALRPSRPG